MARADTADALIRPLARAGRGDPIALNLRRAVALLVDLVVTGQRHPPADALATLLWPESDCDAGGCLRRTLHRRARPLAGCTLLS